MESAVSESGGNKFLIFEYGKKVGRTPMNAPSAQPVVAKLLEQVLPGSSRAMVEVRERVVEFAFNPLAKTLLIEGPVGAGKSTLARAVSMVKRIAPLVESEARSYSDVLRFDAAGRIDLKSMPWYVEISMTGLAETLAEAQLFGSILGAFTGAIDRPGIFEQAMTGRMRKGKEEPGALLTSGVVFLDEIGDLSGALQAKLLPVLSGGVFCRLGTEGNQEKQLQYTGTTITASWRDLANVIRGDLFSRISAYRIRMPGLEERMEDFELILDQLQNMVIEAASDEISRMIRAEQAYLDRAYWTTRLDALAPLSQADRRALAACDWGARGNMRGLAIAIQRVLISGTSVKDALPEPNRDAASEAHTPGSPALLAHVLHQPPERQGLAGHLRAIEVEQRRQLSEYLLANPHERRRVAESLGMSEDTLTRQLYQLGRRRTGKSKRGTK
jgi:DNA-binding NtrC family response regulator